MAILERIGGFLIDLDGTLVEGGKLIPGAVDALRLLAQKKIPYRIVTNTTSKPRSVILKHLATLGLELAPDQLITAPIIGASSPQQLGASLAAAEFTVDDDLKHLLDERTHEYRMGDAPR